MKAKRVVLIVAVLLLVIFLGQWIGREIYAWKLRHDFDQLISELKDGKIWKEKSAREFTKKHSFPIEGVEKAVAEGKYKNYITRIREEGEDVWEIKARKLAEKHKLNTKALEKALRQGRLKRYRMYVKGAKNGSHLCEFLAREMIADFSYLPADELQEAIKIRGKP